MSGPGFFDPRGARMVVRRMKMRRALIEVRASVDVLLDRLDQTIEADRNATAARIERAIALLPGDFEGVENDVPVAEAGGIDMREKELLQGVNLVLKFLDTLGFGLGHGLFSSGRQAKDAARRDPRQPLCRGAKKSPPESGIGGDR